MLYDICCFFVLQFYKSTAVEQEKELKYVLKEPPAPECGRKTQGIKRKISLNAVVLCLWKNGKIYCCVIVGFSSFICSRFSTSHTTAVSKATRRRRVDIVCTAWNFFSCIFSQSVRQHANLNGAQEGICYWSKVVFGLLHKFWDFFGKKLCN